MFSGSDEFVLREIADESHNIHKVINILMKNMIELEFSNHLKLYKLGKIDEQEFNQRYENYKYQREQINGYIFKN